MKCCIEIKEKINNVKININNFKNELSNYNSLNDSIKNNIIIITNSLDKNENILNICHMMDDIFLNNYEIINCNININITTKNLQNIYTQLINIKKEFPTKKTFIDLGCGNGRALIYALIAGFENSKGIEFVEERVTNGNTALNKIKDKKININLNNVFIKHGDLFDLDNSFFPENSIIFISNLLYSKELNDKMIDFFNNKISVKNIVLIISKKLDTVPNEFTLMDKLLEIPMSWDKNAKGYVYIK